MKQQVSRIAAGLILATVSLALLASSVAAQVTVINMVPVTRSGEICQDSETSLAVNPANPLQLAGSAFTWDSLCSSFAMSGGFAPIYVSEDGGHTWSVVTNVPSTAGASFPTGDITLRFSDSTHGSTNTLYAGILHSSDFSMQILRTVDFRLATPMTLLDTRTNNVDQPHTWAASVPTGPDAGKDRVYVGFNNGFSGVNPQSSTVDFSLDAEAAVPTFTLAQIETRSTGSAGQDGFATPPATNPDGTVYVAYYGWRASSAAGVTTDVVVVRDDNWATGATPFTALTDSDGFSGRRVVQSVTNVFGNVGQQRLGASNMSIAVDPGSSSRVYVAWGDQPTATTNQTLHVRRSTDRGVTWSTTDLLTVANGISPSLAINSQGKVGFLYQQLTGSGAGQRWETHFRRTTDSDGAVFDAGLTLADTPALSPAPVFQPYLGDYDHVVADKRDFYGIFSANNTPTLANFPNGVTFRRFHDLTSGALFADGAHTVPVSVSIDPFFFHVSESGHIQVPSAVAFGSVCSGDTGHATLNVCNTGGGSLSVSGITSSNPQFAVATPSGGFPVVIAPGSCFPFEVTFTPAGSGLQTGTLTVASDDPTTPSLSLTATAHAEAGSLGLSSNLTFDPTVIQSIGNCHSARPFVISNTGTCNLTITNVALGGANAADFSLAGLPAFPITLQPGHAVGSGDLNVIFGPNAVARERIANIAVTFVSNPTSGTTSTQTRELCGEGVRTGARVLVTEGGVPMAQVHEIELKRFGGVLGFSKEVDEVKNVLLQSVAPTPGTSCPALKFHREYGAVTNDGQLRPGIYQLKIEAKIAGHEVRKKVWFNVDTCGFNGTIVVDF
jgi:hypothetical protein